MSTPWMRNRRLRQTLSMRRLVRETHLSREQLIYPLFVVPGTKVRDPISSMPGIDHFSCDTVLEEVREVVDLGVQAVLVFGEPEVKDAEGSAAWSAEAPVQRAVSAIKEQFPDLVVITDVCLCAYTLSGHCGVVEGERILNDPTLPLLAQTALSHVRAGADIVAPSDMMDGHVAAIRAALDDAGFSQTPILGYSAKYASAFYGPFREAEDSAPAFGDRRSYQMDPGNLREALKEVQADIDEGADMVMVKPALAYLDVVRAVSEKTTVPVVAYNVSGEYAMIKAAAAQGWIDERQSVYEVLTGMIRAGAQAIISYHAKDVARWMDAGQWE